MKNKLGMAIVGLYSLMVTYKIFSVGFSEALPFIFVSSQAVWGFFLYQARKEIKTLKALKSS